MLNFPGFFIALAKYPDWAFIFAMKITILGNGITGQAVGAFCQKHSLAYEFYVDNYGTEKDFARSLEGTTHVVYSPGAIHSPFLRFAQKLNICCMNDLDFAQIFYSNRTIAITGTNGKTSTAEMLRHVLQKFQIPAILTGNIGMPPLGQVDALNANPDMWNICEVSSYQARDLSIFRPDYSIWTSFAPNHRDMHGTLEDYFFSKWNLVRQTRHSTVLYASILRDFWAKNLHKEGLTLVDTGDVFAANNIFPCAHQERNFHLIQKLLETFVLQQPVNPRLLLDFSYPAHRLHCYRTVDNLSFWNDSKATNSAAVRSAVVHVKNFCDRLIWLTCGRSKGEDEENFRDIIAQADGVLAMGEAGLRLCEKFSASKMQYVADDAALVGKWRMFRKTLQKYAILLSPGFSSFDRFHDYAERGRWFEGLADRFSAE